MLAEGGLTNDTVLLPCVAPKVVPVMVISVPIAPVVGDICVIAGTAGTIFRLKPCETVLDALSVTRAVKVYVPRVVGVPVTLPLAVRVSPGGRDQRLVPEIQPGDLDTGGSGVRAQAITPGGELEQDFRLIARPNALHVLNAPSPAATAALAIGTEIAAMVEL
jgi:hypothetical protein